MPLDIHSAWCPCMLTSWPTLAHGMWMLCPETFRACGLCMLSPVVIIVWTLPPDPPSVFGLWMLSPAFPSGCGLLSGHHQVDAASCPVLNQWPVYAVSWTTPQPVPCKCCLLNGHDPVNRASWSTPSLFPVNAVSWMVMILWTLHPDLPQLVPCKCFLLNGHHHVAWECCLIHGGKGILVWKNFGKIFNHDQHTENVGTF